MRKLFVIKEILVCFAILGLLQGCNSGKTEENKAINKNWIGDWHRNEWQNEAGLTIKGIKNDSLEFDLGASSGGHTGEVDGKAVINNNKAVFVSETEYDTCVLEFELLGDSVILIDQVKGNCFAAMGVEYSGRYYNKKYVTDSAVDEELNPENASVLEDSVDNNLLKELTGDGYALFASSTQLTNLDEDQDLDSLQAKVYSSGVRGLFTIMENIVMINSEKKIWAAVINDSVVDYYTNSEEYRSRLPKTIEKWRDRFKEKPVIYKSAK